MSGWGGATARGHALARSLTCALALVGACATTQSSAPAPKQPASAPDAHPGLALGAYQLPALPLEEAEASASLREGLAKTRAFVTNTRVVTFEGGDQGAFEQWMQGDLKNWMRAAAADIGAAVKPLEALGNSQGVEPVVAAALVALNYRHLTDEFVQAATPPMLRHDPELVRLYREGLEQAALPWLRKAEGAMIYCRQHAQAEAEAQAGLQPWAAYCEREGSALALRADAIALRVAAEEQRQLDAQGSAWDAGPAPAGSEACWNPSVGAGPEPSAGPVVKPVPALVHIDMAEPSRAPLLGDERERLRAAVQARLSEVYAAADLTLAWLDDKTRARLLRDWQAGRTGPGGARCALGSEYDDFLRAAYANLEAANVWAQCEADGACKLRVALGNGAVASALGYGLFEATLADTTRIDAWLEAVSAMQPVRPGGSMLGILRGRFRAPPDKRVTIQTAAAHGPWRDPAAARGTIEAAHDALAGCHGPDDGGLLDVMAVLDLAADGAVRALWMAPGHAAAKKRDRCVAAVLKKLRFEAGEVDGRRLALTLTLGEGHGNGPRDHKYGTRHLDTDVRTSVASTDQARLSPAPLSASPVASRMARCLANEDAGEATKDEARTLELDVELNVRGDGRVSRADVQRREVSEHAMSKTLASCLQRALEATRFNCTSDNKPAKLTASICLRADPPPDEDEN